MRIALGILDDNLRDTLRAVLEHEGHEVFRANGGTALLKVLPHWQLIDAAVVDVRIPEIDCFEVIRMIRCRKEYERLPVVVIGYADSQDLHIIESFGGNHVDLTKQGNKALFAAIQTVTTVAA